MSNFDILRKPLLTEKSTSQHDQLNQVSFIVDKSANKAQIKEVVQKAFSVSVLDVRTINVQGKKKRLGRSVGKRPDWKKALITLKKGDKIEYFEGA